MTMKMPGLNEQQLLDELRRLEQDERNAEGFTMREIAAAWGCAIATARERVKVLLDAGRMCYGGRRAESNIVGETKLVPVYQTIEKGQARGKKSAKTR